MCNMRNNRFFLSHLVCGIKWYLLWSVPSNHTLVRSLQGELPAFNVCLWSRVPQSLPCLYPFDRAHMCQRSGFCGQVMFFSGFGIFKTFRHNIFLFLLSMPEVAAVASLPVVFMFGSLTRLCQACWWCHPLRRSPWSSSSGFLRSSTEFSTVENTLIPSGSFQTHSNTTSYCMTCVRGMNKGTNMLFYYPLLHSRSIVFH